MALLAIVVWVLVAGVVAGRINTGFQEMVALIFWIRVIDLVWRLLPRRGRFKLWFILDFLQIVVAVMAFVAGGYGFVW